MKYYKRLILLIILSLFLGLFSCSKDDSFDYSFENIKVNYAGYLELDLTVNTLLQTRAEKDIPGTREENAINDLLVFIFKGETKDLIYRGKLKNGNPVLTEGDGTILWYEAKDQNPDGSKNKIVRINKRAEEIKKVSVIVLANLPISLENKIPTNPTWNQIREMAPQITSIQFPLNKSLGESQSSFLPMYGEEEEIDLMDTENPSVVKLYKIPIVLERMVAKLVVKSVNILQNISIDFEGTQQVAKMNYLRDETSLLDLKSLSEITPTIIKSENYKKFLGIIDDAFGTSPFVNMLTQTDFNKVFYLNEYNAMFASDEAYSNKERPQIILNLPLEHSENLYEDNWYRIYLPREMKRNHIYELEIFITDRGGLNINLPVTLKTKILVKPWNNHDLGEEEIKEEDLSDVE